MPQEGEGDKQVPPLGKFRAGRGCLSGQTRTGAGVLTTHVSSRLSEPDPSHTLEERVVHWYFKLLDKNNSGDIGKKEIKPFKRFLRKKSKPKKCVKKFVEYCDVNNDKSISLQELMGCLGATREEGKADTRKRHSKPFSLLCSHPRPLSMPLLRVKTRNGPNSLRVEASVMCHLTVGPLLTEMLADPRGVVGGAGLERREPSCV